MIAAVLYLYAWSLADDKGDGCLVADNYVGNFWEKPKIPGVEYDI